MLQFKPITLNSLDEIRPYLYKQSFRTCDFTIGGIYMWIDYFKYEYCITEDLLFIKGYAEEEMDKVSFSIPIGSNSLQRGISLLQEYCHYHKLPLLLSAVPQEGTEKIEKLYACQPCLLVDWSDYLYNREELATLSGRKFNKKRNHVNKFYKTYTDIHYSPITPENINDIKSFFFEFKESIQKESPYFAFEEAMVDKVLEHFIQLGFIGGMLTIKNQIVAFSIGEIINDTLFVHIEKADRSYAGAYEIINMLFAQNASQSATVDYINREEDVGDEGIRRAKQSYNPIKLLKKFNIHLQ